MTNTLSPRLGGFIICVLIGFVFPLFFLFAGLFAFSIFKDLSVPEAPTTSGHKGLTEVTDGDESWIDKFHSFCESPAETAFLTAMISAFDLKPDKGFLSGRGLNLNMQVPVSIYRLDFLVDRRLVVEIDGAAYHSSPEAIAKDKRRDVALNELGFEVLRIPAKITLFSPSEAVARVKRARLVVAARDEEKADQVRNLFRPRQIFGSLKDAAIAVQEGISFASEYVDQQSKLFEEQIKLEIEAETAERRRLIQEDLDSNERLAAIHAELVKSWRRPARRQP